MKSGRSLTRYARLRLSTLLYEARWRVYPILASRHGVSISLRAIVRDPRLIRIETGSRIGFGAELWTFDPHPVGGKHSIICNEDSDIRPYALLHAYGGFIEVGSGSCVNSFCFINGAGGVRIGAEVMMGTHCALLSSEHGLQPGEIPMTRQSSSLSPIVVEENVYIGAGVTVLAGVRIGTGAVVGAGSVVRVDVPPCAVVAGVPARIIRYRQ